MARQKGLNNLSNAVAWFVVTVVSLATGSALINGTVGLPAFLGGATATGLLVGTIVGWTIVAATIFAVVLSLIDALS